MKAPLRTPLLVGGALLWGANAEAFQGPFSEKIGGAPGVASVALHSGSYHRDGLGLALSFDLLPWLQFEGSGAYRYEVSLAAGLRVLLLPSASLSPYVTLGVDRSVSRLKNQLRYTSYSTFAALGLQARVAGRWFVGVEGAALFTISDEAKVGDAVYSLTPADRFDVVPGGRFGFYFF